MIKNFDNLLMTSEQSDVDILIDRFNAKFSFPTVVHRPGVLKFHAMTILRAENCSSTVHADEKLNTIESFPLSRVLRRQFDSQLNDIDKSSFMLVNFSIGWL